MNKFTAKLQRSSPVILTCLSMIGMIGTTVMAVRATPKALRRIKAKKDELKTDELAPVELVEATWQCYIPSALVGIGTVACIAGIGATSKHNQAVLMSAYAMINESYKQYQQAAKKVYGEDADEKIHAEMAKDANVYTYGYGWQIYNTDMDPDSEYLLFYDSFLKRYFNTTMAAVLNAQYHINRNLQCRGYSSVNEYCKFLGIEPIEDGDKIGWSLDDIYEGGEMWLDFDNQKTVLEDGLECIIITSYNPIDFNVELLEDIP